MTAFTHLHVHTQYSLLDGAARIPELVARAKELGMSSLAITDHGVMYGIVDFYKECKKVGIKPILGMEAYVAPRSLHEKEGMREYAHLILLCKNNVGLKNLMKLSTIAFTEGFYYKPRIDYDLLEAHSDGLICLSACLAGDIPQLLLEGRDEEARALARRFVKIFGDDFYIEIQNHGIAEQLAVLPKLIKLAQDENIQLVATNDIHYVNREDAKYQDILLCIQTNSYVDDENRMKMSTDEFYLKSAKEMSTLFSQYPDAISNTEKVAEKCDVTLDFSTRHMPKFEAPDGMDNVEYLNKLCDEGLVERNMDNNPTARERLDYEISVITSMGFCDYFLIVHDFIAFARRNGIVIGPGRGSGVGSLVAYCLHITDVDPLKYNLLFERLLNPERVSMPDIDVDMCIERRQEVIDYVAQKYGEGHVAQIATFGTMMAKGAIKDVGRAMHLPPDYTDKLSSLVPKRIDISLKEALVESPEFAAAVDNDPNAKRIVEYAQKVEGLQRHASTHAAGVVISPEPLTEYVPLHVTKGVLSTQFTKDTVEELGLLKMDFLGLRTLTVIRYCLSIIEEGGKTVPDLDHMSYDDKNIYDMISRGDTSAVFQLESSGMTQFMTRLKPECFEDIIAGISLYRPGPMDRIPDYIKGKFDKSGIKYADERLRPILEPTYGVMVYQEQVMQIVRDLAGYSMGRSDLVRRAMAKKKFDVMQKERENFLYGIEENGEVKVKGAIRNGVKKEAAEKIFNEMMDFASYAFNKSHAAAYAVLAYKTAYLKFYYPLEFMTAMINSFIGNADKIAEYVYRCISTHIKILPPDINKSKAKFTTEGDAIRIGLAAIKNVGESAVDDMIKERQTNGEYVSFFDFIERNDCINKRMVEGLIKAGAFSSTGAHRSQLLTVYNAAMDSAAKIREQRSGGQVLLFDFMDESSQTASAEQLLPDIAEYDDRILSAMEKSAIGMYLTKHPLNDYVAVAKQMNITAFDIANATEASQEFVNGMSIRMIACIHSLSKRKIKSGGIMATGLLEDLTGRCDFLAFPTVFSNYSDILTADNCVYLRGRLSLNDEKGNAFMIDEVKPIDTIGSGEQRIYLRFTASTVGKMQRAEAIARSYPGNIALIFFNETTGEKLLVPKDMYVNASPAFMSAVESLLGKENVKLTVK